MVSGWRAAAVVGELGTSAAVGVMVGFGLDAAEGRVAAVGVGLCVGLLLLAWGLRRPLRRRSGTPFGRWAARRAEYPRTLVYDPEARGWVAAPRRSPRIKS